MENILIYLRAEQHKTLQKRKVCVRDIGSIYCEDTTVAAQVGGLVIDNIIGKKAVIQMIDIIERITKEFPNAQIINFGAPDILVEYEIPRKNKFPEGVKVFLVCVLIFFGSAFTIMAFNNDISITGVFEHFYTQMTGADKPEISELEIFYAIGLAVGIILFFNHIGKKKLSDDVTPIQVEMDKHNKDTYDTIIDKVKEKQNV